MAEIIGQDLDGRIDDKDAYVHAAYERAIGYYRNASRSNKFYYKSYRFLTIFLGAIVTLTSSLAATTFVEGIPWLDTTLDFAVPIIAAFLTIITGLSQNFQWGSAWRNMMVNKQRLEGERDRFLATEPRKRDYRKELLILNGIVLAETESFFQRVLDSETYPSKLPPLDGTKQ
jgi:hypothetical protein